MASQTANSVMQSTTSGMRASSRRRKPLKSLFAYLFVFPHLLLMLAFSIGPALYAVLISFASFPDGTPHYFQAGLDNYIRAYTDFRFAGAFLNVGRYLFISLPFTIVAAVVLALLLQMRPGKTSSFLRTSFFIPGAVTGPALVLLFIFMFDPNISPFRPLLQMAGFSVVNEVVVPKTLPLLFTIMTFFVGAGIWVAIFVGALNGISTDVLEAATIDGANAWQKALHIKFPLIRPYIVYMFVLMLAGNVQLVAEPQMLAGSQIGNVPATWSPNQLSYEYAFALGNFGGSAAIALIMVLVGLIGAYSVVKWTGMFQIES